MPAGEAQAGPVLTASEGGRMMQALSKISYLSRTCGNVGECAASTEACRPMTNDPQRVQKAGTCDLAAGGFKSRAPGDF